VFSNPKYAGSKSYETEVVGIFNNDTDIATLSSVNNLTYLLLPMDLTIGSPIPIGKQNKIYGIAGLYVGFLLSGTSDRHKVIIDQYAGQTLTTDYGNEIQNLSEFATKTDAGLRFGVGISFRCGLMVNAYYLSGLNNLNSYHGLMYYSREKNRIIMISFSWLWSKKAEPSLAN